MSGMKGQHGPGILKCSKCKLQRDAQGRARTGGLVRAVGWADRTVRRRHGICTAYALYCMNCGHVGWYTHRRAASLASKGKQ